MLLNQGDGTFASQVTYGARSEPDSVAVGDLDGDGDRDVVTTNWAGNNASVTVQQHRPLEATTDIDPDTLNLKSKAKWVTVYMELPERYDVADIDEESDTIRVIKPVKK